MPGDDLLIDVNADRRGRTVLPFEGVARAGDVDYVGRAAGGQDEASPEVEAARDVEVLAALRHRAGDVHAAVEHRTARFVLAVDAIRSDAVPPHRRHVNSVAGLDLIEVHLFKN